MTSSSLLSEAAHIMSPRLAQWALCSGLALEPLSMGLRESNSPTVAM